MKVKPKRIASSNNQAVKETARLKRKRNRYAGRLFLTEGEDLLDAALERGVIPRRVFSLAEFEEKAAERLMRAQAGPGRTSLAGTELFSCPNPVLTRLSGLGSGSRVISVFSFVDQPLQNLRPAPATGIFLYLAGVADPGNVGTLVRAAAAFGAGGIILGPGSADPYSSKALRATMGSIFQVPVCLNVKLPEMISWASEAGLGIIAADPHKGGPVWKAGLANGGVLVLGTERGGLSRRALAAAGITVKIPQKTGAESLNVAMAGSVLLYEASRQRDERNRAPGKQ